MCYTADCFKPTKREETAVSDASVRLFTFLSNRSSYIGARLLRVKAHSVSHRSLVDILQKTSERMSILSMQARDTEYQSINSMKITKIMRMS